MVEKLKIEPDYSECREAIGYASESELLKLQNKALSDALDKANALLATRPTDGLVGALEGLADRVCLRVCELPDRTSPEDWPEACLVTSEELHAIIQDELSAHKGAGE